MAGSTLVPLISRRAAPAFLRGRGSNVITTTTRQASYRLHSGNGRGIDPKTVVIGLMGVNGCVYLGWQAAESNRALYRFMIKNFTVSKDGVMRRGRVHTLVTSMFSHQSGMHLAVNCFSMYFFGIEMLGVLGIVRFLQLYLGGGIFSSGCHMAFQGQMPGLGASGAVYAVMINSIVMFPYKTILLYGIIPMPAFGLGLLLIGSDIFGAQRGMGSSNVGHAAHLGGAAFGAGFYALRRGGKFLR